MTTYIPIFSQKRIQVLFLQSSKIAFSETKTIDPDQPIRYDGIYPAIGRIP